MSYTTEVPVYVGASSLNRIARSLILPEMVYDEKNHVYYYTAKEIRKWCDYDFNDAMVMLDNNLDMFYTFCCYRNALQSHASDYISTETSTLEIKGKERKNAIRKLTKKYRFILS